MARSHCLTMAILTACAETTTFSFSMTLATRGRMRIVQIGDTYINLERIDFIHADDRNERSLALVRLRSPSDYYEVSHGHPDLASWTADPDRGASSSMTRRCAIASCVI